MVINMLSAKHVQDSDKRLHEFWIKESFRIYKICPIDGPNPTSVHQP